jgi:8-oxo-dGTP diphosphatase
MELPLPRNPAPTVDIVIVRPGEGIALVERRFEPVGWALPGGFVDYGETVETAAMREALEETGLTVALHALLGVYSDPVRDKRQHTISTVFIATTDRPEDILAGDDAARACFFSLSGLPVPLVFDHALIIEDFVRSYAAGFGL